MVTTYTECAMKQEFLNSWNSKFQEFPWVTSRTRSLRDPTQQDFIHARTLPIYKCHTRFKFLRTLQSTLCEIEYNQEGTPKMTGMLIF